MPFQMPDPDDGTQDQEIDVDALRALHTAPEDGSELELPVAPRKMFVLTAGGEDRFLTPVGMMEPDADPTEAITTDLSKAALYNTREELIVIMDHQSRRAQENDPNLAFGGYSLIAQRFGETQIIDVDHPSTHSIYYGNLPLATDGEPADFIVGSTNGGLTIHAQVGDQKEFGDTPQEALDAAIKSFEENEAAIQQAGENLSL